MKKLFLLFAVAIVASSCDHNMPQAPERQVWYEDVPLYGDIASVTVTKCDMEERFGELIQLDVEYEGTYSFNSNGDVERVTYSYSSHNKYTERYDYIYDENGRVVRKNKNYENGSLDDYVVYKYNSLGQKVEKLQYYNEHSLEYRSEYKYDISGNMVEEIVYNSRGSVYHTDVYKYNLKGKPIEKIIKYSDGYDWTYNYKYDRRGRKIEEIGHGFDLGYYRDVYLYDNKGNLAEKIRYNQEDEIVNKHIYRCDTCGNIIEDITYNGESMLRDYGVEYKITYYK